MSLVEVLDDVWVDPTKVTAVHTRYTGSRANMVIRLTDGELAFPYADLDTAAERVRLVGKVINDALDPPQDALYLPAVARALDAALTLSAEDG